MPRKSHPRGPRRAALSPVLRRRRSGHSFPGAGGRAGASGGGVRAHLAASGVLPTRWDERPALGFGGVPAALGLQRRGPQCLWASSVVCGLRSPCSAWPLRVASEVAEKAPGNTPAFAAGPGCVLSGASRALWPLHERPRPRQPGRQALVCVGIAAIPGRTPTRRAGGEQGPRGRGR